jgi:hypothetical protein
MMDDKDIQEYHNLGRKIPFKEKFQYISGKQITDEQTGKRVYEVDKYRLPSVTTILGATKNQDFLKKWKAKVGEQEQNESRIIVLGGEQYAQIPRVLCGRNWL